MVEDTFFDEAYEELKTAGILNDSLFIYHPEVIEEGQPPVDAEFEEGDENTITEETMPVHEAIRLYLKNTPTIGVNWLARRSLVSKKKINTYLETGKGLQPVQVMSIVGILQEKAVRIKDFEQNKLERDKALEAL